MPQFDLPLDQLRSYRPDLAVPDDLDAFWKETLAGARALPVDVTAEPVDTGYRLVETLDVSFRGFAGDPVRAWLHRPAGASGELPVVVEYAGYSGGRGLPHERISYALAGHAHLLMDTRGQGWGGCSGDTPDPHPEAGAVAAPGMMTRGVLDPRTYYYRRLVTDAVRAVDAARALPGLDPARVVVAGVSQGGGLALAAAALCPDVAGALVDVPFLCHMDRAVTLVDSAPYREVGQYLTRHRERVAQVLRTLSYVDGAVLAPRATAPALFSVGLMDDTCPPSTVFAAYNRYGTDAAAPPAKDIRVYPFNRHEGGGEHQHRARLAWLRDLLG